MGIKSIKVVNLLSFDELVINDLTDINCIIGKNNVGKSNLLKLLRFYYAKLEDKRELPPNLHSNYSSFGSITIVYDTTRIKQIVTSKNNTSNFLKHIYNVLFKSEAKGLFKHFLGRVPFEDSTYELTLIVNRDESIGWSSKDKNIRNILHFLYPFFEVETRHIDLYDWEKLWYIISRLKSFNLDKLEQKDIIDFFDSNLDEHTKSSYSDYITKIDNIIDISTYSYREKVLNYIKVGLQGHTFTVAGEELNIQSDGTNSHKYLELLLTLLITLTRREYITPTIYVDEPETGLHPKRNEELISKLHDVYSSFKKTKTEREIGKYKTPYPKIIFSTHSPNILKYIIKLFDNNQQVFHFSKKDLHATRVTKMNSQYSDKRFLSLFSDNEARLFFSNFILFVEGETELEIFSNLKLLDKFPKLKSIDIYKNNNVTLKSTNPSDSNLSIPYLVLYDADKLLDFNIKSKKMSFRTNSIHLEKLLSKLRKAYYGSNHFDQRNIIYSILAIEKQRQAIEVDNKKIKFTKVNIHSFIKSINKYALLPNNYMIAATTIEGSLINKASIPIFKKWLVTEIIDNLHIKSKKVSGFKKGYAGMKAKNATPIVIFNSLFGTEIICEDLINQADIAFVNKVKYEFLKSCRKKISNTFTDSDDHVIFYRLIFNGKTDTLISSSNSSYGEVDQNFRDDISEIKSSCFDSLDYLLSKTGGWVSSFLNYSINYISKNTNNINEFETEFNRNFPELYDIIELASSSIE